MVLQVKDLKIYRTYYKENIKKLGDSYRETDFIGSSFHSSSGTKFGFFEMVHGDKEKIENFIKAHVKMAEDDQAIYEFLQNAVDCNSSEFYVFYDENYFLVLNNGKKFDFEGVRAILNLAASTKTGGEYIGKFGIGFKLIHRLVGKNDGIKEIVEEYKGPLMFSWEKKSDFLNFVDNKKIENSKDTDLNNTDPWLFKILMTSFPCGVNEKVRDIHYKERVPFTEAELERCREFLRKIIDTKKMSVDKLESGTLFFLELGKGKKENYLDRDSENLKHGTENFLNLIKNLETVNINGNLIKKREVGKLEIKIQKESKEFKDIDPEDKDRDIGITILYGKNSSDIRKMIEHPTLYKYFPMGEEFHNSGFLIHSNAFDIATNRRQIPENTINIALFKAIKEQLTEKLKNIQCDNFSQYINLYENYLLSKNSLDAGNDKTKHKFFSELHSWFEKNIPTFDKKISDSSQNVLVKCTSVEYTPLNKKWFYITQDDIGKKEFLDQAIEKLKLKKYDVLDILINEPLQKIENWLVSLEEVKYLKVLSEINMAADKKRIGKILNLKFIKGSNDSFYSLNDFKNNTNILLTSPNSLRELLLQKNILFPKYEIIKYKKLFSILEEEKYLKTSGQIFKIINNILSKDLILKEDDKLNILNFLSYISSENIGEITILKNRNGINIPLKNMIIPEIECGLYLEDSLLSLEDKKLLLKNDTLYSKVKKSMIQLEEIYGKLITERIQILISKLNRVNLQGIEHFYREVIQFYESSSEKKFLKEDNFIYTSNGFFSSVDIFYNKNLKKLSEERYNIFFEMFNVNVPHYSLLPFFERDPFKLTSISPIGNIEFSGHKYDLKKIIEVIEFFKEVNEDFFLNYSVNEENELYTLGTTAQSIHISNGALKEYIKKYLNNKYSVVPKKLKDYCTVIESNDSKYLKELLDCNLTNGEYFNLIKLVKDESREVKEKYLKNLPDIILHRNKNYENSDITKIFNLSMEMNKVNEIKNKIFLESSSLALKDYNYKTEIMLKEFGESLSVRSLIKADKFNKIFKNQEASEIINIFSPEIKNTIFELKAYPKKDILENMDQSTITLNKLKFLIEFSLEKNENFLLLPSIKRISFYTLDRKKDLVEQIKRFEADSKKLILNFLFDIYQNKKNLFEKIKKIFPLDSFIRGEALVKNSILCTEEKYLIPGERISSPFIQTWISEDREIKTKFLKEFQIKILRKEEEEARDSLMNEDSFNSMLIRKLDKDEKIKLLDFVQIKNISMDMNSKRAEALKGIIIDYEYTRIFFTLASLNFESKAATLKLSKNLLNNYYFVESEDLKIKLGDENPSFTARVKEILNRKLNNIILKDFSPFILEKYILGKNLKPDTDDTIARISRNRVSLEAELLNKSIDENDKEHRWQIGRIGEAYIYEEFCTKYKDDIKNGKVRIVWSNENSRSIDDDNGATDILFEDLVNKIKKFIEVKSTIFSPSNAQSIAFYMSKNQWLKAKSENWDENYYLIFVTDVLGSKEKLIFNFKNNIL